MAWTRFLALALLLPAALAGATPNWQGLETGLDYASLSLPRPGGNGPGLVHFLRIDPKHFRFRLLSASAHGQGQTMTARQWCEAEGLLAAMPASMFQTDGRTSVSRLQTMGHANNRHLSQDKSLLLFDCLVDSLPGVQIVDRSCQNFAALDTCYASQLQSTRMISCSRSSVWIKRQGRWSSSLLGQDDHGRILFIFSRSLFAMPDLIDALLAAMPDLSRLQYGDGGSYAQLFFRSGNTVFDQAGSYKTRKANPTARPLPNVIGIERRPRGQSGK